MAEAQGPSTMTYAVGAVLLLGIGGGIGFALRGEPEPAAPVTSDATAPVASTEALAEDPAVHGQEPETEGAYVESAPHGEPEGRAVNVGQTTLSDFMALADGEKCHDLGERQLCTVPGDDVSCIVDGCTKTRLQFEGRILSEVVSEYTEDAWTKAMADVTDLSADPPIRYTIPKMPGIDIQTDLWVWEHAREFLTLAKMTGTNIQGGPVASYLASYSNKDPRP